MATNNERDGHSEKNDPTNDIAPPKEGQSEVSQVIETMRQLIVEIHSFKIENEKLKKSQQN